MIPDMKRTMQEAMELMRAGDLHAATQAILGRLGGGHGPDISDAFPGAVLDFFEAHPKP